MLSFIHLNEPEDRSPQKLRMKLGMWWNKGYLAHIESFRLGIYSRAPDHTSCIYMTFDHNYPIFILHGGIQNAWSERPELKSGDQVAFIGNSDPIKVAWMINKSRPDV